MYYALQVPDGLLKALEFVVAKLWKVFLLKLNNS